jgi:hypothetical protein
VAAAQGSGCGGRCRRVLPDDRASTWCARRSPAAGLRGELGIGVPAGDEAPRAEGTLWLLREGCLLTRIELAWGVPALDVVLEGSFEPGELYDDVVRDQALVGAALQVIAALLVPLAALVEGSRDGALAPAGPRAGEGVAAAGAGRAGAR